MRYHNSMVENNDRVSKMIKGERSQKKQAKQKANQVQIITSLLSGVLSCFEKITDIRQKNRTVYTLRETFASALAMFQFKYPSLLMFNKESRDSENEKTRKNLKSLYGLTQVPSDSQMREILDPIDPKNLTPAFREIHRQAEKKGIHQDFIYLDNQFILAGDGTSTFESKKIKCPHCCVKNHRDGSQSFYHQCYSLVLVHPDLPTVLPLDFEPITQADGNQKNDCEANASKRLIPRIAQYYSHYRFIVTEDALASNAPHINMLRENKMNFIIVAKPKSLKFLFQEVDQKIFDQEAQEWEEMNGDKIRGYRFIKNLPLNRTHPNVKVNFFEYWEIDTQKNKESYWTWITDLEVNRNNAYQIMRAGRAKWKIENETHNTLKNQGYHLEHNYGHGSQYLSSIFLGLCILSFLLDQIQESFCPAYQKARKRFRTKYALWEQMRSWLRSLTLTHPITHKYESLKKSES